LTPPSNFCNPNGVCAGTSATCGGTSGWECVYPSTYEETEVSCDDLDNDCDGAVDEPFALKGTSCSNGTGVCERTGTYVCNSSEDGTVCDAPPAGSGSSEVCNDLDDDCDGTVDEDIGSSIPTVAVPIGGGATVMVMKYEASRPDATETESGQKDGYACSNPNVLPWTNVTWAEARDACCALNPSGTCSGGSEWRLCDAEDWETACEAGSSCDWSYDSSCSSSQPMTCNGEEYDCDPGTSGDQDCLWTTGDDLGPFGACYADWGSGDRIWDMSGNVKEWTNTSPGDPDLHYIRGGSYNNVEAGRTCQFDFTVGDDSFAFPNTGFRCCLY
ncbi:MAG: MopE-related protein, partial [Polyangiales bacterium]